MMEGAGDATETALGVQETARSIGQSFSAQQAAVLASMAKAHDKMLRDIYFQKLQSGKHKRTEKELIALRAKVDTLTTENETLRNATPDTKRLTDSQAAQQAAVLASMAKAHDKMLRDIYFQKLQNGKHKRTEKELIALRTKVDTLTTENETLRNATPDTKRLTDSQAAQQAAVLASMAKAHDKMLRDIYFQKLQRGRNAKVQSEVTELKALLDEAKGALAAQQQAARSPPPPPPSDDTTALREENAALKTLVEQTKRLAEAGMEHRGVTAEVLEENQRLQLRVRDLERSAEVSGVAPLDVGETQLLRSRVKRLEIENMKLERRVHDLASGPPESPPAEVYPRHAPPSPPVDRRVGELEMRVRDLEVRGSPRREEGMITVTAGAAAGFTARVACDVHGVKHNVRLCFYQQPAMAVLVNAVDLCYDISARASHPPGCPDAPFTLAALQIFDAAQQRWVDLTESLLANTKDPQLFCFQHSSVWHPDRPGTIPVAETVDTWLTVPGGPKRSAAVTSPPPRSVMVVTVFKEMLTGGEVHFLYSDFRAAVQRLGLELTGVTAGELFAQIDRRRDGVVTRDEWVDHCKEHPHFIETLYFKALDARQGAIHESQYRGGSPHRDAARYDVEQEARTPYGAPPRSW